MIPQTAKDELKKLAQENPAALVAISSGLLEGFTAREKLVILSETGNMPTVESICAIPQNSWTRRYGIGQGFLVKLTQRGWLKPKIEDKRITTVAYRRFTKNRARLNQLKNLMGKVNRLIGKWEAEMRRDS